MLRKKRSTFLKKSFLFIVLFLLAARLDGMCPTTTPWTTPAQLTDSGIVISDVVSAATSAGFMVVWVDSSNSANYSFSTDGSTWQSGLITPAAGDVGSNVDVFVAGNANGFLATWVDGYGNAWSTFTANNGNTWSTALQINPHTAPLLAGSSVYVAGGKSGFVATMIGNDQNLYVSFSTRTAAWSSPTQVTFDGSVFNINGSPKQYVSAVVVGNSCMLTWIVNGDQTNSAYFESINPFSPNPVTINPIVGVGEFETVPTVAQLNGYFVAAALANVNGGATLFSIGTNSANWSTASLFTSTPPFPYPISGSTSFAPWITANQTGFMSTWNVNGNPIWLLSADNGFDWTPQCSILATPSATVFAPVALSANSEGFMATWVDTYDLNAYASFYATSTPPTPINPPTNVTASRVRNTFLLQTDLINHITWDVPSSGPTPVAYKIYRDAALTELITKIPASGPLQFYDHNRQPMITYNYYIVAIDSDGNRSAASSVSIVG